MYPRKYSLKTRYNFNKVFKYGIKHNTDHLIILYLKVNPEVFKEDIVDKKFAVITSAKLSKKAVVKNRVRRIIGEAVRLNVDKFPPSHYYVFIPKKEILDESGKVKRISKAINTEIDTFLSKVAFT